MNTTSPDHVLRTTRELVQHGRLQEAEALYARLNELRPGVETALVGCEIEEARREWPRALDIATKAIEQHGEHPKLHLKRAHTLMAMRRRSEAFAAAERSIEIAEPSAELLMAVASMYMQSNDAGRARSLLYRALERAPDNPAALYSTALSHFYLNELAEAEALLVRVLEIAPGNGFAWHIRSQLATQTREANHISELRSLLMRPRLRDVDRMLASFALAKELEDVGEFAESFEILLQANRIKRAALTYDVTNDVRAMQNVMTHYSAKSMQALARGDETRGPIFIIGMPRTGTTLVERILGSHSEVTSIGEAVDFPEELTAAARAAHARLGLTDSNLMHASLQMDFGALGRNYVTAIRHLAGAHRYTIDKLPFNFRYAGLIHKALPKASIVHLTRDPMDTCYAIFKTMFINAYHFSYQLDELAEYFVSYRRMMDHWRAAMPGVILDIRYEELVSDPEMQCRRLLAHCELPWEDQVLHFHTSTKAATTASAVQVRRPIYRSSVHKWRNFARELEPVRQRLAAAGLVDENGDAPR